MVRNSYGDVVMLVSGTAIIAYYKYDAWGNCTVYNLDGTVNTASDFIGNINPFRWKGHYYDVESGLYQRTTGLKKLIVFFVANAFDIISQIVIGDNLWELFFVKTLPKKFF